MWNLRHLIRVWTIEKSVQKLHYSKGCYFFNFIVKTAKFINTSLVLTPLRLGNPGKSANVGEYFDPFTGASAYTSGSGGVPTAKDFASGATGQVLDPFTGINNNNLFNHFCVSRLAIVDCQHVKDVSKLSLVCISYSRSFNHLSWIRIFKNLVKSKPHIQPDELIANVVGQWKFPHEPGRS